jgi:hypothetical protein
MNPFDSPAILPRGNFCQLHQDSRQISSAYHPRRGRRQVFSWGRVAIGSPEGWIQSRGLSPAWRGGARWTAFLNAIDQFTMQPTAIAGLILLGRCETCVDPSQVGDGLEPSRRRPLAVILDCSLVLSRAALQPLFCQEPGPLANRHVEDGFLSPGKMPYGGMQGLHFPGIGCRSRVHSLGRLKSRPANRQKPPRPVFLRDTYRLSASLARTGPPQEKFILLVGRRFACARKKNGQG